MDGERAGVDIAHWIYEADDPAGSAQIEAWECFTVASEMEEGISGEYVLAVSQKPLVELALLCVGRVEFVPDIGPTT